MSRKKQPPSRSGHGLGNKVTFDPSRRRFIAGVAGAAGALALPGCDSSGGPSPGGNVSPSALPAPDKSGIDHIVVVMMENRSFDHFLGWAPGADGLQAGLRFSDKDGQLVETFRASQDPAIGFQGCGKEDPDHSFDGGRTHLDGGKMDGWLQTVETPGDTFPVGYYTDEDLPFNKAAVQNFTICDRYFSGILASTFPNRVYMHSGQTDRLKNTLPFAEQEPSTLPTIWDLLQAKRRTGLYYFHDLPFTGLWGNKYTDISFQFDRFLVDAAAGNLPDVAFVDPCFGGSVGESPSGISKDDHPQADVRDGQAFLNQVYDALRASPRWENTLLIINYDEWGGFFDHVVPGFGPITEAETTLGNDGRLGFRVPFFIIGPRARRGHVSHLTFDPSSILNLIRWRFDLGALSPRDETSLNLAFALDFANPPNLDAPAFDVPTNPTGFGMECQTGIPNPLPGPLTAADVAALDPVTRSAIEHAWEWESLRRLAIASGFPL